MASNTNTIRPNILITGTPGTGKSYLCKRLVAELNLNWMNCSQIAKDKNFICAYDERYNCPIIDEDKLLDYLEPLMQSGGNIIEYHSCDFFPERWFDAVYVVTCDNTMLYDRLESRGYNSLKLQTNIECEILNTIVDEAFECYKTEIVQVLKGETENDCNNNVTKIKQFYTSRKVNKS